MNVDFYSLHDIFVVKRDIVTKTSIPHMDWRRREIIWEVPSLLNHRIRY